VRETHVFVSNDFLGAFNSNTGKMNQNFTKKKSPEGLCNAHYFPDRMKYGRTQGLWLLTFTLLKTEPQIFSQYIDKKG